MSRTKRYIKPANRQISWALADYERKHPKPNTALEQAADRLLVAFPEKKNDNNKNRGCLVSSLKSEKKKENQRLYKMHRLRKKSLSKRKRRFRLD